jgi:hypothetical protein
MRMRISLSFFYAIFSIDALFKDAEGNPATVKLVDFVDYYTNVGCFVDSDAVFAAMMTSAWGIRE